MDQLDDSLAELAQQIEHLKAKQEALGDADKLDSDSVRLIAAQLKIAADFVRAYT